LGEESSSEGEDVVSRSERWKGNWKVYQHGKGGSQGKEAALASAWGGGLRVGKEEGGREGQDNGFGPSDHVNRGNCGGEGASLEGLKGGTVAKVKKKYKELQLGRGEKGEQCTKKEGPRADG